MKLRHPALIRFAGFAGAWLLKGWHSTLRIRIDYRACGVFPLDRYRSPSIYALWHENLLVASPFGTKGIVLIGHHADAELMAQAVRHMNLRMVRGSSRRGGTGALLRLLHADKARHLVIPADGPLGPRRQFQSGTVFLASRTGRPIVLIGIGYEKAWRAKSWDRFAAPYPFSLATFVLSAPIHVPAGLKSDGLESYRRLIQERFDYVTEDAERWATSRPRLTLSRSFVPPLAESA